MNIDSLDTIAGWIGLSPIVIILLIAWTFLWKGLALWRAALLRHKYWFIAILIINTLGVLEIIYLFLVSKKYKVERVEEK